MKADLLAWLKADAGLAGLVGTAIHWQQRPQGQALPAITLAIVSSGIGYSHGGVVVLQRDRVSADIWGASSVACEAIVKAYRNRMEALTGTQGSTPFARAFHENRIDMEPEASGGGAMIWRSVVDFFVFYSRT